jgi:hypothetical protein
MTQILGISTQSTIPKNKNKKLIAGEYFVYNFYFLLIFMFLGRMTQSLGFSTQSYFINLLNNLFKDLKWFKDMAPIKKNVDRRRPCMARNVFQTSQ